MAVPDQAEAKVRTELMWYVREATPEISTTLRWLASVPFIDNTWFGFGTECPCRHRLCRARISKRSLFLTPIITPDQRIAEALSIAGDPVEILTVNLISDREYELIKNDGLDAFLDLLDENDYPAVFDPARRSFTCRRECWRGGSAVLLFLSPSLG